MNTRGFPRLCAQALALLAVAVLASGCATTRQSSTRDPRDPLEGWNRSVYNFNASVDAAVAQPVAKAYAKVTPKPVRSGVANFLGNIAYPGVLLQDLLQAKPQRFLHDTGRLLVNTTVGIGGLFDPATRLGLQANNEDFGQTFGRWGIAPGPYLMLPLLGPSTLRDSIGTVGDHFAQPATYYKKKPVGWGLSGMRLVERRAQLLGTEAALERYMDPYAFVRNSYLQRRIFLIYDGNPPDEDVVDDDES